MIWFRAPRYFFPGDVDVSPVECPGMIDVDGVTVVIAKFSAGFVVQAYDLPNETCLVGVTAPMEPLSGWTALTVAEAQAEFEAIKGRAPTAAEVF